MPAYELEEFVQANSFHVSAKKWKRVPVAKKKASEKRWSGARFVGRSNPKRSKKGNWYVTVYRKKGRHQGSFNLWFGKKRPSLKPVKAVPRGTPKSAILKVAKHNRIIKAPVKKMSPFSKAK